MLPRLFKKKKEKEVQSFVGYTTELVHDVTVFQTGVAIIEDVRLAVKTVDGSELCKGTLVRIVREDPPYVFVEKV